MSDSVPPPTTKGVTEKIVMPRLGKYEIEDHVEEESNEITDIEKKGLRWTGIVLLISLIIMCFMFIPEWGILRGEDGSYAPFFTSIVPLMFVIFFLAGITYGIVTKSIRGDKAVADMTAESMSSMGAYIVLAFVAAQFVAFFNWSNLGLITAVKGADGLKAIGFSGIPLIVAFILVSSCINILIGSASAKWAIMAPIFVPMLMLMGYSPELTQAAYRIGDSYTNILTPLLPYFPLVIVFAQKYVKNIGLGTIISTMLPFAIVFAIIRIIMMIIWLALGIPVGPDAPMFYSP